MLLVPLPITCFKVWGGEDTLPAGKPTLLVALLFTCFKVSGGQDFVVVAPDTPSSFLHPAKSRGRGGAVGSGG